MKLFVLLAVLIFGGLLVSSAKARAETQTIPLSEGFNFVSPYVYDATAASASLLATNDAVEQVFSFDAGRQAFEYHLELSTGNLFGAPISLTAGRGYVIKCRTAGTLTFSGDRATNMTSFVAAPGFNFVGFPPLSVNPQARTILMNHSFLKSIFMWTPSKASFDFVLNVGGGNYFGTDFTLEPGTAYFLNAETGNAIVFGTASSFSAGITDLPAAEQVPGTGQIAGQLTLASGGTTAFPNREASPIDRTDVKVWLKGHPEINTLTDAEGRFVLKGVPVTVTGEKHTVEYAKNDGTNVHRGFVDEVVCLENKKINVNEAKAKDPVIEITSSLTGQIFLDDGLSPQGAEVFISGLTNIYTRADEDGTFTLPYVPEGSFNLVVKAQGYEMYRTAVTVQAGKSQSQGQIRLHRLGSDAAGAILEGFLTDAMNGAVHGVSVNLVSSDGSINLVALTDANGFYSFRELPSGNYKIVYAREGYKGVKVDVILGPKEKKQKNQKMDKYVEESQVGFAYGIVKDATRGTTIPGVMLTTIPPTEQYLSDANGLFSFLVKPGQYTVTARKAGYSDTAISLTIQGGQFIPAEIGMASLATSTTVASLQLNVSELTLETGQLFPFIATLKDASGNILPGRTITWTVSNQAVGRIGANGVFTALSAGSCYIFAAAGAKSASTLVTVSSATSSVKSLLLVPPEVTLNKGLVRRLSIWAEYVDGTLRVVPPEFADWSISNGSGVLTISDPGVFVAIDPGAATVRVAFDGHTAEAAFTVNAVSNDTLPPIIAHQAPTQLNAGQELPLYATASDDRTIAGVTLHYRRGGDIAWVDAPMSFNDGVYGVTLPAEAVTVSGIDYYISASDGVNTAAYPSGGALHPVTLRTVTLAALSLAIDSLSLPPGATYDLGQVSATAVYSNFRAKLVRPTWSIAAADGEISGVWFMAPTGETTLSLVAIYEEPPQIVTATLEVRVIGNPFIRPAATGYGWTVNVFRLPGYTNAIPDFTTLGPPVDTFVTEGLDLASQPLITGFMNAPGLTTWFALHATAKIDVQIAGTYELRLTSDDGSRLIVDGRTVITNDGLHTASSALGAVYLASGQHEFVVHYFQGDGPVALRLEWNPLGFGFNPIRNDWVILWTPTQTVNTPPTASFTVAPQSGDTQTWFFLDASGSGDLEDGVSPLSVRWDWEGDGFYDTPWAVAKTSTYLYPQAGSYEIRCEVRDTGGLTGITARRVTVVPSIATSETTLSGITIHPTTLVMSAGGYRLLSDEVKIIASYADGTTREVHDGFSWTVRSGGGMMTGHGFTAPGYGTNPLLAVSYGEGGQLASAHLTVTVRGCVGWWRFDEGSGATALDSSGAGNHGAIVGAVHAAGIAGGAVELDGTDDRIDLPAGLLNGLPEGSVSLWIRPVLENREMSVFSKNSLFDVTVNPDGTVKFMKVNIPVTSQPMPASPTPLASGGWHHIVVTCGAGGMKLYVNGLLADSNAETTGIDIGTTPEGLKTSIGFDRHVYYKGAVDDCQLFNYALSGSQVRDTYNSILNARVLPPVFSLPAGTYASVQTVEIACATPGARILYTLDNAIPITEYEGPFPIPSTVTLKAVATKVGMTTSETVFASYILNIESSQDTKVATPVITLPAGSYDSARTVEILCATSGASIRYTIDGTQPNSGYGLVYTGPVLLGTSCTLKTLAYNSEGAESDLATAIYSFRLPGVHMVGDTLSVDLGGGVTMTFVWIPPGTFQMGSPDSDPDRSSNEGPVHNVTISKGYWLAETECTQAQWLAVMSNNPSQFTGDLNLPVERVSWTDIAGVDGTGGFIGVINARELGVGTFRLPTEAEWEYACRAGSSDAYYWGTIWDGAYVWSEENNTPYGSKTVRGKTPNMWNLYDMSGNVWEWCSDRYSAYPSDAVTDPQGPTSGSFRVVRGGWWLGNATVCRSAFRTGCAPTYHIDGVGFRPVIDPYISISGKVETPAYSTASGTYETGFNLTITCPTAGATIRYTTDGSTPSSTNGLVYSAPIAINRSITVKAIATKAGCTDSAIMTGVYAIRLLGWWRFDEGAGTVAHDSGALANHAPISGATWTDGVVGKALRFDGLDDYALTQGPAKFGTTITYSAWVKVLGPSSGTSGWICVATHRSGDPTIGGAIGSANCWLSLYNGYCPTIDAYSNTQDQIFTVGSDINDGKFHMLHWVITPTNLSIYVDGQISGQTVLTATPYFNGNFPIWFGNGNASWGGSNYDAGLNGIIDEFKIYGYALRPDEIQEEYNLTKPMQ